ncbi:hypothetical protein GCM10027320_09780 [Massilia solisilvae]
MPNHVQPADAAAALEDCRNLLQAILACVQDVHFDVRKESGNQFLIVGDVIENESNLGGGFLDSLAIHGT